MLSIYFNELWQIMLELSAPLLFGLLLAGIMRVYLPPTLVRSHLSKPDFASVFRASLIGVPMPLCSCGVVPTAIGLREQGASKGATTSFLISTPQTGVDSVLVSASMLGWPFAIFKLFAAFVSGIAGGLLVNRFTPADKQAQDVSEQGADYESKKKRLSNVFSYALFDLLGTIDLWLIGGILAAAAITTLIPADFFQQVSWAQGIGGMLLVLLISLPLYVCTTASVPLAASLIAAGMPAGTALVFLMAGPATNIATVGAIYRALGVKVLTLYLGTVIVASVSLGLAFDFVLSTGTESHIEHVHHQIHWWQTASAYLLTGLLVLLVLKKLKNRFLKSGDLSEQDVNLKLKVEGMTCPHCVSRVKNTLEGLDCVDEATPDLSSGWVYIKGQQIDENELTKVINKSGYKVLSEGE
jgi:uncharacterized membrane protein YraQ (UPF0718 family)/copper chaperone CopZ